VQLLNLLASHVAFRSDIPQWNEIFDELSDYAVYHLQTEETIWHEFFVDDISEVKHRNTHASFIEEVERLKAGQASKPKSRVVEDALDFLVRWLVSHILKSDRYMAYTVLAMKEGMTLNEAKLHAQEQMGSATQTLVNIILSIYSRLSANTLRLMRELAEHQQAKIALMRESERNRALLHLASDGIHILDQDGNIVEASDSFCAMLGYLRDDIVGMNVADWDAGFSKVELFQLLTKICASPDCFEFETRHRCKDGNLIEVEVSAILVQIDKTPLVYASSRDITKRKQTELALHESQKRFYDIALASADWIWEVDAQSRYTYVSDSVFSLLGYHPEELRDKTPFDFMPPDEANRVAETFGKIVATKSPFQNLENIVLGKNGSEHVILTNGTPILDTEGNLLGYRGVDRDITEQRQAENALNESRNLLKTIIDTVPVRIFWKDRNLHYLGCNLVFARDAGIIDSQDLIGKDDYQLPWAANADLYRTDDRQTIDTGIAKLAYEEPQTTPEGKTIYLRTSKVPLRNPNNEIIGVLGVYDDISELKKAEVELNLTAQRLNEAQNLAHIGNWELDLVTNRLTWSDQVYSIFEIDKERFQPSYEAFLNVIHPGDRESVNTAYMQSLETRKAYTITHRLLFADGRIKYVNEQCETKFSETGKPLRSIGTVQDITERKRAEDALRESELHFRTLANGVNALIWTAGINRLCDYFNDRWLDFRGRTLSEELGDGWTKGVHPEDLQRVLDIYFSSFDQRQTFNMEYRLRRADGEYRWIHDNGTPRFDSEGNFIDYIGFCYDITEKQEHQQQLEYIAHYDSLTGMPNRKLLDDRLRQAMVRTKRRNQQLTVVYIDLDGFKAINDNYGHAAGDQLLMVLANRMKQCVRDSDTIARLGGDEFVAVLVDLPDIQTGVPLIRRLLAAAAQPVGFNEHALRVSSSIGVTYYAPTDDTDADQLLRQADQAMYQAKLAGKNRYHVFDAVQDRTVRDRHANIERIQQALANNEFILYYQPKVNLRSGEVFGAEALIRWQHPERGLLPPSLLLPEIEDHPLGVKLGEWVINNALIQLATWQSLGLDLSISVNIAANHLLQQDFVERLHILLATHSSVPSNRLELEILETSALENISHVSAVIAGCNQLGVQFSLDDFGTGYSSLTYLKRLPVRTLKIDQSFVRDMLSDTDDLAIIKGVLGLAASFNREVIAEGVETQAHGEALLQLGCELAQGYGIARPMPASDFYVWFETSNRKI
jgi:diguanylate cyclase (GGDEF)-like protein/PAS domain S-box-containing protein/hemerythrin-like metal-binding protein